MDLFIFLQRLCCNVLTGNRGVKKNSKTPPFSFVKGGSEKGKLAPFNYVFEHLDRNYNTSFYKLTGTFFFYVLCKDRIRAQETFLQDLVVNRTKQIAVYYYTEPY